MFEIYVSLCIMSVCLSVFVSVSICLLVGQHNCNEIAVTNSNQIAFFGQLLIECLIDWLIDCDCG